MFAAHELWLLSRGASGARAQVVGANLADADLSGRNLSGATFTNCELRRVNFNDAQLDGVVFSNCAAAGTTFIGANLSGASFVNCNGLSAKQFAAATLAGATLPGDVATFPASGRITEISKRAYALLVTLIGICVTSAVAISSASDAALLANSGALPLPGTTLTIPTATFFVAMPLVAATLWLFFQLTLFHLLEQFAALPKVFPDGEARHEKGDIWLFSTYIATQTARNWRNVVQVLQWLTLELLIWWLVPFVVLIFWATYLKRHDELGNRTLSITLVVIATAANFFRRHAARSLRSAHAPRRRWLPLAITVVVLPILLWWLSAAAFNGIDAGPTHYRALDWPPRQAGLQVLSFFNIRTTLRIRETTLPPFQRNLRDVDVKHMDGYGLGAPGGDLRGIIAAGAFLSSAVLSGARLDNANLEFADIDDGDLKHANIDWAQLELASAGQTHFDDAHAQYAKFTEAFLWKADFTHANLEGSDFRGADLRGAIFRGADVRAVDFYRADLRGADFTGARNMEHIKCLSGANVDGIIGLEIHASVAGAGQRIYAHDDDDYRKALARHDPAFSGCGWDSTLGWEIAGPPAFRMLGVSPRSLRMEVIELPKELPRYVRKDLARFMAVVQKLPPKQTTRSAFEVVRASLAYEKDESAVLLAVASPTPFELRTLQAYDVRCVDGSSGYALRFDPFGFENRIDLDHFIADELKKAGDERGIERVWTLEHGMLVERKQEGVIYQSCEDTSPDARDRPH